MNGCEVGLSDGVYLRILRWTPTGWFARILACKIVWLGVWVIIQIFGWSVRKRVSVGQSDGSVVDEYNCWGLGDIDEHRGDQRCQNHGCWLMHTKSPMLSNKICCWM